MYRLRDYTLALKLYTLYSYTYIQYCTLFD